MFIAIGVSLLSAFSEDRAQKYMYDHTHTEYIYVDFYVYL